jgi:surface protein
LLYDCKNVDFDTGFLNNLDTSEVTDISYLFWSCQSVKTINLSNWDTSNVTTMVYLFYNNYQLVNLDISGFDTSKVTSTQAMFDGCKKLKTINAPIDMINVTYTSTMFESCQLLEEVTLKNIRANLTFGRTTSSGYNLSLTSLINAIQELWDLTGTTSKTLTLSTKSKEDIANIYVKLVEVTDEMIAQDQYAGNKKPCVVCEPTDEGAMTLTEYATSKNWAIA